MEEIDAAMWNQAGQELGQRTIAEVCSVPRLGPRATEFGLKAGKAYDIETGTNLLDPKTRKRVWDEIAEMRPTVVMLSPPCGAFSIMQNRTPALFRRLGGRGLMKAWSC